MTLLQRLRREVDLAGQMLLPEPWIGAARLARYDVLVNSYPKAGRTWLRLLLVHGFAGHFGVPADEVTIERMRKHGRHIPFVRAVHGVHGSIYRLPPGQITAEREVAPCRFNDVIVLVRDPRDVMVSLWYHRLHRHRDFDGSLWDLAMSEEGGFEALLTFMRVWHDHQALVKHVMFVRYEDMLADTRHELRRMLTFIGIDAAPAVIDAAVDACSFENMRKLELSGASKNDNLRPGATGGVAGLKTRSGKAGGWRNEFTPAQIETLNAMMDAQLPAAFGYNDIR